MISLYDYQLECRQRCRCTYSIDCGPIVNIPDANFKLALVGNKAVNTNLDGEIQVSEATVYNGIIDVNTLTIADLTGIEAFVNITQLLCYSNQLTSLDLTSNTKLFYLDCADNLISNFTFTGNAIYTTFIVGNNSLTGNLDISGCTNLIDFNCANNSLTSLALPATDALRFLQCQNNQISVLDLSAHPGITGIFCSQNQITSLDFSANINVTAINCGDNLLTSLNIQNGNNSNLTTFVVTGNTSLECIQVDNVAYMQTNWNAGIDPQASFSTDCSCIVTIPDANFKAALLAIPALNTNGNGLIECSEASAYNGGINVNGLNISDLTGIEAFPLINQLSCQNNQLTSIDVSNNTALVFLYISGNQISSLDVSNNTVLENLRCGQNLLTNLDLSTITSLKYLYADDNQLTNLNVSNNAGLLNLECNQNDLTSLDVTGNPVLENLRCVGNDLTSIDISSNPLLQRINFQNNQFTDLDLSSNAALTEIYCQNNQLTSLNMQNGNNTGLLFFNATNNPSLQCIQVDDVAYMQTNWNAGKDASASFSEDCSCIVYIPDANFKAALLAIPAINTNGNGLIECAEASSFTGGIDVSGLTIADLTGIEAFTKLLL